ncbi:MAG: LuxR C-terminal-related transcriptional regulator [Candidatus Devosia phytovorans]|uniref:LuxR C-terminal-related transcriptional regulator n=1 Tax=Candidatus Devosia phytovorans TaxID=3121372 RepID=A0AAJ5VTA8_9HYPH|nr:LuxR C-terminal-related transcriptional regulator [Devosia sp.]WEK03212.1 MAG: LuxR C-terminal-related transcriptional regulator [Devosia sp.]
MEAEPLQIRRRRPVGWDIARLELRRVADVSPLMVWITEPDGYCIHLNQNWYDYTGQPPGEGEGDGWVEALHKEDRALALNAFLDATSRKVAYQVEYRLCRKVGGFEWVFAVGHPFFGPDGKLGGYIGSDTNLDGIKRRDTGGKRLTPREREVVHWIAKGKTSIEIAVILSIAARTVEQHATAAMIKLGSSNRVQTAVLAIKLGEIEP